MAVWKSGTAINVDELQVWSRLITVLTLKNVHQNPLHTLILRCSQNWGFVLLCKLISTKKKMIEKLRHKTTRELNVRTACLTNPYRFPPLLEGHLIVPGLLELAHHF